MLTKADWDVELARVESRDASPKPKAIRCGRDIVFWARAFSVTSGVTPEMAAEALAGCGEMAKKFGIRLPDYCMSGYDALGRTILLASHIPGCRTPDKFTDAEQITRIDEFSEAYRADPLYRQAAIGDLWRTMNYGIDTTKRVWILDIGDVFPPETSTFEAVA